MDWTKGAHNTLSCCNTYGSWKRCVLFTACWMKNLKHLNDKTTNPVWCRNIRKCKGWQLVKPFTEKSTHLIFWVNRRIRTDEPRLTSEAVWRTNFSYQNIHMVPNWSNVSLVEHLFFFALLKYRPALLNKYISERNRWSNLKSNRVQMIAAERKQTAQRLQKIVCLTFIMSNVPTAQTENRN